MIRSVCSGTSDDGGVDMDGGWLTIVSLSFLCPFSTEPALPLSFLFSLSPSFSLSGGRAVVECEVAAVIESGRRWVVEGFWKKNWKEDMCYRHFPHSWLKRKGGGANDQFAPHLLLL